MKSKFNNYNSSYVNNNFKKDINYNLIKDNKKFNIDIFLKYLGIVGLSFSLGVGIAMGIDKLITKKYEKKLEEKIKEENNNKNFNVNLNNRKSNIKSIIAFDNNKYNTKDNNKNIKPSFEKKKFTYVQVCAVENDKYALEEYRKYHNKGLEVEILPLQKGNKTLNRVMINCYDNPNFLSWFLGENKLKKGEYFTIQREKLFPVYSKEQKIELIKRELKKTGLDENLLLSIWSVESDEGKSLFGFKLNYDKIRNKHFVKLNEYGKVDQITAIGDFMINPQYHKGEIRDLIHFENNLKAAINYLVVLDKKYNGDINQILSEWNGGTNKMKWKTAETKKFVKKVLEKLNTNYVLN